MMWLRMSMLCDAAGYLWGKKAAENPAFNNPLYDSSTGVGGDAPQDKHSLLHLEGGEMGTVCI
jgi:hypothetical protein